MCNIRSWLKRPSSIWRQSVKLFKVTCNSSKLEERTVDDEISNDNEWYPDADANKFKYCKLMNVVKIYVNICVVRSFVIHDDSYSLISITRDVIWFFKLRFKRGLPNCMKNKKN